MCNDFIAHFFLQKKSPQNCMNYICIGYEGMKIIKKPI